MAHEKSIEQNPWLLVITLLLIVGMASIWGCGVPAMSNTGTSGDNLASLPPLDINSDPGESTNGVSSLPCCDAGWVMAQESAAAAATFIGTGEPSPAAGAGSQQFSIPNDATSALLTQLSGQLMTLDFSSVSQTLVHGYLNGIDADYSPFQLIENSSIGQSLVQFVIDQTSNEIHVSIGDYNVLAQSLSPGSALCTKLVFGDEEVYVMFSESGYLVATDQN